MTPILPRNYDVNKITYGDAVTYKNIPDKKHVPIRYDGKKLFIEIPLASAPLGITTIGDDWILDVNLDLESESNPDICKFKNIIRNIYAPLTRRSTFRTKLPQPYIIGSRHNKSFTVYNNNGNQVKWYSEKCKSPVDASWNVENMLVKQVVYCSGLWLENDEVKCEFILYSLQFY
jgi:hypothetical protein